MKNSSVEWTHHTFNPWRGCTKVSPGCANCYAETLSKRNPDTLGIWGPNGTRVVASESMWREPLKWDREAKKAGERHRVFCASLADVFEDWQGPMTDVRGGTWSIAQNGHWWNYQHETTDDDWGARDLTMQDVRERLFRLIDQTPNLDWLLLTKRPENIKSFTKRSWWQQGEFPSRIWIGTSVENQQTADERIPHLLKVPAVVRFLSVEPLLGPIDLTCYRVGTNQVWHDWLNGIEERPGLYRQKAPKIDWVIVGGESGTKARPCNVDWIRSIVFQCKTAGVPVFVKQLGARPQSCRIPSGYVGKFYEGLTPPFNIQLNDRKGGDPEEWPEDLRVQEFPKPAERKSC